MAKVLTDSKHYTNIAEAIRAKGVNGSFMPEQMASAIGSIEGGAEITDGIIVTARDANGYPIEAELYCSDGVIHAYTFGNGRDADTTTQWKYLQRLRLKNRITRIDNGAFYNCKNLINITSDVDDNPFEFVESFNNGSQWCYAFANCGITGDLVFSQLSKTGGQVSLFYNCQNITGLLCPEVTSIHQNFARNCKSLKTLYLPKCVGVIGDSQYCFGNCTALETAQLGSVGNACGIGNAYNPFSGCTQTGLTITMFCTGAAADRQLSYIRNGATNATIVIKASEQTTYNSISYNAGDTMITSIV